MKFATFHLLWRIPPVFSCRFIAKKKSKTYNTKHNYGLKTTQKNKHQPKPIGLLNLFNSNLNNTSLPHTLIFLNRHIIKIKYYYFPKILPYKIMGKKVSKTYFSY